jgi:phenylalanine-4-hydroxylase
MSVLNTSASVTYLQALEVIGFSPTKIPNFVEMNERLGELTGWYILTVPELCPAPQFFKHLADKKFTATCWLRKMSQLDYLEEPDMFHDVFGHAPLLTNAEYCTFFKQLGELAVKHTDNADILDEIERLYWFTIEFGLINEGGEMKIYGSGIISSKEETMNALSATSVKTPFSLERVLNHTFRTDTIQPEYFVIDSFAQLAETIPALEKSIAQRFVVS